MRRQARRDESRGVVGASTSGEPTELLRAGTFTRTGIEPSGRAIGEISEAIVQVAESRNVGLIVLGTREPSQVERMLGHSVSETVQRMAHCDVLIVH
jgi:nucleotide-binding universal stress UspA family protein